MSVRTGNLIGGVSVGQGLPAFVAETTSAEQAAPACWAGASSLRSRGCFGGVGCSCHAACSVSDNGRRASACGEMPVLQRRARLAGIGVPALQQRGFTLIEILITLVVLIFGVYAMLRIFPRGFTTIEVSQQRTIAAQLADAELTRWKVNPENLPDAIVATDYQGNLIAATSTNNATNLASLLVWGSAGAVLPGTTSYRTVSFPATTPAGTVTIGNLDFFAKALIYRPLDLTPSQFDGALGYIAANTSTIHPGWQPNSLYLPRTVLGERVDIKYLGRTVQGVPFYLLSHAPLDVLRFDGTDNPATPTDERTLVYALVYDAQSWTYVPSAAVGTLTVRQFTLTSSTGTLRVGSEATPLPDYARQFKVDYTNPTTRQRVLGFTVTVPASASAVTETELVGVDPDTVVVHEQLIPITTDQYNSGMLSETGTYARRNIYYVDVATTVTGKIQFPLVLQVDPQPTDASVVKVDYRVYDWSVLMFDVEVPADGVVRLPTGAIKGPGFTNPPRQPRPQEVARGIKRPGFPLTDPTTWAYVVAVDRQSGELLADHEGPAWPVTATERSKRFLANYQNGILRFNYTPTLDEAGMGALPIDRVNRTYRIFCRGAADWAVQLMVTPRLFGRSSTEVPGGSPVGTEGQGSALLTYAWRPDKDRRQLYFPLSESGQTVAVDYYATVDGKLTFVEGEIHTIGQPSVTDLGQWVCPLATRLSYTPYYNSAQPQSDWGPIAVRGLGVRARTVWVSPGHAATLQDLVTPIIWSQLSASLQDTTPRQLTPSLRETWRQEVMETYLTRAPI